MTSTDHIVQRHWRRRLWIAPALLALFWAILLIPEQETDVVPSRASDAPRTPFVWAQNDRWFDLERRFVESRASDAGRLRPTLSSALDTVQRLLRRVAAGSHGASDTVFSMIEDRLFAAAPLVAGCPDMFPTYLRVATETRDIIKDCSVAWPMDDTVARRTMYRLIYGGRAAIEEVMLQLPSSEVPALVRGRDAPSRAPSAVLLGVPIHSGDILVSRGGAPTSALIARGNDFPGNFSHVALIHVDAKTGEVSIIESHIEKGVAVATIDDYLRDKKLRVMVMRLREDHPAVLADPMAAHRAAEQALMDARTRHVPYDFEMRYDEPSKLFCSEVASAAYATVGVRLWKGISTISTPGLRAWLGAFGVRYFETQEPSDLEYDPQLSVVAEWRDPETLYQDHADNAVTEAMLEGAERGDRLDYAWILLPMARAMKAYSVILNLMGSEGPVPEGMTATAALRNRWYSERHAAARAHLMKKAETFQREKGYRPPYWRLLEMARTSLAELGD